MKEKELKPCPFCGEGPHHPLHVLRYWSNNEQVFFYSVNCNWCGGQAGGSRTKSKAIAAWNRRAK
jgi:Lar family restriction alleviation protein